VHCQQGRWPAPFECIASKAAGLHDEHSERLVPIPIEELSLQGHGFKAAE
jgi:hypothetical protein